MDNIEPFVKIIAILTRMAAEMQSEGLRTEGFGELSMRQIYYLDVIANLSNPTPTELAMSVNVTKPSISAAIDRLEKLGLVRKAGSDEDRRSYHLHLTEKGVTVADFHDRLHRQMAGRLIEGLTPKESEQFLSLVTKIAAHITKEE